NSGPCGRAWPFNPYRPMPLGPALQPMDWDINQRGPYVRVAGSLITDSPHDVQTRPGTFFSRFFAITASDTADWEGSVPDWHPGKSSGDPEHFARWTEIHPLDLIEVLPPKQPTTAIRGVALAARTGLFSPCEQAEFDLSPEVARPANATLAYEELRGPECFFPRGQNADNGSWVKALNDHIHVKARVCGGLPFGSPGRFKALYRVWWKPGPPSNPPSRVQCLDDCATARDSCVDRTGGRGGTVPATCAQAYAICIKKCPAQ